MKPRLRPESSQFKLFQSHFDQLLNPDHPLLVLARKIDWNRFQLALEDCYSPDLGAPAKSSRLIVGLLYLKHAFNLSDEALLERWIENPYWQSFCGFESMQHHAPIHSTSLTKWRNRVGTERLNVLLQETIDVAVREKQITKHELTHVTVDTTVQEKNIAFPTDSKLYYRAITKLARAAATRGIKLRQSYVRVAKQAAIMVSRYAHAKQFKRMRRELRKLKTWLCPFDGHTLASTIASVEKTTGVSVCNAYVDKGYRGHDYQGEATIHIAGHSNRGLSTTMKRRRRRRSAVEPKIGHLKSENRMNRCYLNGLCGDAINVVLAAAGSNLRKLLRALAPAPKNWLIGWLYRAIFIQKPHQWQFLAA